MPPEVVRRQVQHRAYPRAEGVHRLELITAHFQHVVVRWGLKHRVRKAARIVARQQNAMPARFEHGPKQLRRGGLAVRPGNRKHGRAAILPRQFEFSNHRHPRRPRRLDRRYRRRHDGAEHHEGRLREALRRVPPGFAGRPERLQPGRELLRRRGVRLADKGPRALTQQQPCRAQRAAAHAHNNNLSAL